MGNLEKYNDVFCKIFEVPASDLNEEFSVNTIDKWDSITQLSLVSEIEDQFDIMLDANDILNFRSYQEGKEILLKYEITF
jgi:acyl carrier protein